MSPLASLHLALAGGTDSIVATFRVGHAALALLVAAVTFSALRRFVDWRIALLSASGCVLSADRACSAAALSYNTMGGLFLGLATARLGDWRSQGFRPRTMATLAGISLGLSALAYPTLAVAAVVGVFAWWIMSRSGVQTLAVASGVALVGLVAFVVLARDIAGVGGRWRTRVSSVAIFN